MRGTKVVKLDPKAKLPTRTHSDDAGIDLYALENIFLIKGKTKVIKTGVSISIPKGYYGQVCDRSSMAAKGLIVGGGVIDSGFAGEISVILHNFSHDTDHDWAFHSGYKIHAGDKIAQLVIQPIKVGTVKEVKKIWKSKRGSKGLGSSGR